MKGYRELTRLYKNYWIKSSIFTISQRMSMLIFGVGSYMILVRILDKQEVGIWSLFLAISTTFELTKTSLLKNGVIRFYQSKNEKTEILSSAFVINIMYSIIAILIILIGKSIISKYLNSPELSSMLYLYSIGILLLILFSHFEYIQQSNLTFTGTFMSYTVRQGVFFIIILIIWIRNTHTSLDRLVIYQNISILLSLIVSFFYTKKYISFIFKPGIQQIKDLIQYGKYIFTSGLLSNIFTNLDRYMVAGLIGNTYVAYYDLSARINNMIDVPTFAIADVIFPKSVIAERQEGMSKVKMLFEKISGIIVTLLIPISIIVIVMNKFIIRILAGNNYLAASSVIVVSMLYAFLRPIQNHACNILNSINKPQITLKINLIVLVLNIVFDYVLIKYFGYIGPAIGSLIVTIIGAYISTALLGKYTQVKMINIFTESFNNFKNILLHGKLKMHQI
ncbi:MAG: oligosaccharide flippase family protein [Thermoflavifilum sp.]|nr:oligosaccharide flippase family protein [Thermoflavifilum sp.]